MSRSHKEPTFSFNIIEKFMGRRPYIPKMGTKKPVGKNVNHINSRLSFERLLKEWQSRNKKYYKEFKKQIETGFKYGDPKVLEDFKKVYSLLPSLRKENPGKFVDAMTFRKNSLDDTLAEQSQLLDSEKSSAWRKLFIEDGLDDHSCALLYWYTFDGGQLTAMEALGKSMYEENLSAKQIAQGDYIIRGVVEKGVTTGRYHKNYWDKVLSWTGLLELKLRIASILMTVRGKGGRKADIYILREIINGPDKHSILKNIENVVLTRKKDTDLACLLMLLVRAGNVDSSVKYKPFHDALKSEYPHAGIGTERRPQQLFNNLFTNPQQLLTSNTRKRCEKRMKEMQKLLEIAEV